MARGFACEADDVAGIGESYDKAKIVTLAGNTSRDARAKATPQGAYWSHLDVQIDITGGAFTQLDGYLVWDANADDPASAAFSATSFVAGLTDASLRIGSVALRVDPVAPTGQTAAGRVYLMLKANAGVTFTLKKARLHWKDRAGE